MCRVTMRRNEHRNRLVREAAPASCGIWASTRGAALKVELVRFFGATLETSQSFTSPSLPKIFYLLKALRTKPFFRATEDRPKT